VLSPVSLLSAPSSARYNGSDAQARPRYLVKKRLQILCSFINRVAAGVPTLLMSARFCALSHKSGDQELIPFRRPVWIHLKGKAKTSVFAGRRTSIRNTGWVLSETAGALASCEGLILRLKCLHRRVKIFNGGDPATVRTSRPPAA
jgi:hypothetical protein